ncbi:hypothetical protein RFI_14297 [Reticulomyxa filosa]|uniref:C2 NT-type domain-containing protein n=1 Tax=Reticulomyxa filosa TaxID=46433 RepID=X6NC68_RETFI|nr:hypothetical protein RFI_14297 [Reticulomyxa filosa]|eukprot:ETO22897.1 hypothetical protein RFI_14297 [Reticulomyxa filosa]
MGNGKQFELTLHGISVPPSIEGKLPADSGFSIVWKHGQEKRIESRRCDILSEREKKDNEERKERQLSLLWRGEPEVLRMRCTLIKQRQADEYMSKPSRLLLKQVCDSKATQPTVAIAKLDLRDYVSPKQMSQNLNIHFTKWYFIFQLSIKKEKGRRGMNLKTFFFFF